jgi:hypothetical protein
VISSEPDNQSETDEDEAPIFLSYACNLASMDETSSDEDEDPKAYKRAAPPHHLPQQHTQLQLEANDHAMYASDSQGHCSESEFRMFSVDEYEQHCLEKERDGI